MLSYNCCITYILERVRCVFYRCPVLCIVLSFMQNVDMHNFLYSHVTIQKMQILYTVTDGKTVSASDSLRKKEKYTSIQYTE